LQYNYRAITFYICAATKAVAPIGHQYTLQIQLPGNHFLYLHCYKAVAPMGINTRLQHN
jgi:hypothetical protein